VSGDNLEHHQLPNNPAEQGNESVRSDGHAVSVPVEVMPPLGKPYAEVMVDGRKCGIYRSKSKGNVEYELKYYLPNGKRAKVSTRDQGEFQKLVERAEKAIEDMKRPMYPLWGEDAVTYKRAEASAKKLRLSLDIAMERLTRYTEQMKGHDIERAIHFYLVHGMLSLEVVPFKQLVEVVMSKEHSQEKWDKKNVQVTRRLADWVYKEMGEDVLVLDVTRDVLHRWVTQMVMDRKTKELRPPAKETMKGRRGHAVMMLNVAKHKNWLPAELKTVAERLEPIWEKDWEKAPVEVFDIFELKDLIYRLMSKRNDHEKYMGALLLVLMGVFAGERTEEKGRTEGSSIDLKYGQIVLPEDVTKTGKSRWMPIPPNLQAFFQALGGKPEGMLINNPAWVLVAQEEFRAMGYVWPYNGLRTTFSSSWLALVKDVDLLVDFLGNSKGVVSSYIKALTMEVGESLFSIYPPGYTGRVVEGAELIAALKGVAYVPRVAPVALPPPPAPMSPPVVAPLPQWSPKRKLSRRAAKRAAKQRAAAQREAELRASQQHSRQKFARDVEKLRQNLKNGGAS
jgi:integrase